MVMPTENSEDSVSENGSTKTKKQKKEENNKEKQEELVKEFETKIEKLEKDLDEANDEIEDRDDQIEFLKADLDAAKTEIKNLKSMVADYNTINDMVVKLTADLQQATSDKSAAEKSFANANFERRQLISQITNLEE